jgi:hypothetical protein
VAVIDGEHSGTDDMIECVKGLLAEPGTAVPEEYALSKKLFIDLVQGISTGDEGIRTPSPEQYVADFKKNFFDYVLAYPDTRPAAVSEDMVKFEYMEKDRATFDENMAAFLEQYPPGSPPMDKMKVEMNFDKDQYEIFRNKFWYQTSDVISGGELPFSAPHIVKQQSEEPESLDNRTYPGAGTYFPYSFSILNQSFPAETQIQPGGPVMGAVIVVTKTLQAAVDKVMTGTTTTLRQKGEALQFLSRNEKAALGVVRGIISMAQRVQAPVVVVGGSIPQFETITATDVDVQEALLAMDIREDGTSKLNLFIQAYRANDFPFYGDYAIHRASEVLAGPRQIIVTK